MKRLTAILLLLWLQTGTVVACNERDTVLLYSKDTSIWVGAAIASFSIGKISQHRSATLLRFRQATILQPPEGVYELYIATAPLDTTQLSSRHTSFAALLDLYGLSAPGNNGSMLVDISAALRNRAAGRRYCYIRFAGVQSSTGKRAAHAGALLLKGIDVLQLQ